MQQPRVGILTGAALTDEKHWNVRLSNLVNHVMKEPDAGTDTRHECNACGRLKDIGVLAVHRLFDCCHFGV